MRVGQGYEWLELQLVHGKRIGRMSKGAATSGLEAEEMRFVLAAWKLGS